jgi:alpha-glucuronidase
MTLDGYTPVDVKPWETASGGKAIACDKAKCSVSTRFDGAAGWYDLRVQYFDQNNGISHFRALITKQVVDEWDAADRIPTRKMDGSSSTRREIDGIALRPGDQIVIEGTPNGGEPAGLDYIEILPPPVKTP